MKEQRIIIEIDQEGRITADADGFTGDTCLQDLERLLDGLSPGPASIHRKADSAPARIQTSRTQTLGKKS
jgi:hypothetical protein